MIRQLAAIFIITVLFVLPSYADTPFEFQASSIDFDDGCHLKEEGVEFQQLICDGLEGYKILYTYSDLRESIGFYKELSKQSLEFQQTFQAINYVDEKIRWLSSKGTIFATLQVHYIGRAHDVKLEGVDTEADYGEVLVLTKVSQSLDELSCVIGYVDIQSNLGAEKMIVELSKEVVSGFHCGEDKPKPVGIVGPRIPAFD